jgi:NAD(P)H-flavin reductase
VPQDTNVPTYAAELLSRKQLSTNTFEIELSRPPSFEFIPGQRIRFVFRDITRDYSLVSTAEDSTLTLCVRHIASGAFTSILNSAPIGQRFNFTGPHGYFFFQPSLRSAIFVATGTGIAPFCAMARSGATGFVLLHGVKSSEELYYAHLFRSTAKIYVPCLSDVSNKRVDGFKGRVTGYLEKQLPPGTYDFYLCGRQEMIRDATWLVDDRFPGSLVYNEIFY